MAIPFRAGSGVFGFPRRFAYTLYSRRPGLSRKKQRIAKSGLRRQYSINVLYRRDNLRKSCKKARESSGMAVGKGGRPADGNTKSRRARRLFVKDITKRAGRLRGRRGNADRRWPGPAAPFPPPAGTGPGAGPAPPRCRRGTVRSAPVLHSSGGRGRAED